jgi:hypothetical protein
VYFVVGVFVRFSCAASQHGFESYARGGPSDGCLYRHPWSICTFLVACCENAPTCVRSCLAAPAAFMLMQCCALQVTMWQDLRRWVFRNRNDECWDGRVRGNS